MVVRQQPDSESGSNPATEQGKLTQMQDLVLVTYTGTGSDGTIAHGLPSAPECYNF